MLSGVWRGRHSSSLSGSWNPRQGQGGRRRSRRMSASWNPARWWWSSGAASRCMGQPHRGPAGGTAQAERPAQGSGLAHFPEQPPISRALTVPCPQPAGGRRPVYPPRLRSQVPARGRRRRPGGKEMAGRFLLPLSRLKFDLSGRVYSGVPASSKPGGSPYTSRVTMSW